MKTTIKQNRIKMDMISEPVTVIPVCQTVFTLPRPTAEQLAAMKAIFNK